MNCLRPDRCADVPEPSLERIVLKPTVRAFFAYGRMAVIGAFLLLAGFSSGAHAQGGPPFITDDPGTPGNGHWEINLGWTGQHGVAGSGYELPDLDLNYGLGNRLQLKYEIPLTASTDENNTTRAGLGDSLLGVKWRPYEHHRAGESASEENRDFPIGFYPQVVLSNPTRSVRRGVVEPGPQYYVPIEFALKLGPVSFNGETGRWIGNRAVSDRWGRGLIVGREFSDRFEFYGEVYDLHAIDSPTGEPRQRSTTGDVGLRRTLDRSRRLRLLLMGGRSLHTARAGNGEPRWMAYVGLQILLGRDDSGR